MSGASSQTITLLLKNATEGEENNVHKGEIILNLLQRTEPQYRKPLCPHMPAPDSNIQQPVVSDKPDNGF